MKAPKTFIPESQKTRKWIEDNALYFSRVKGKGSQYKFESEMWNYYNNEFPENRMDYFLNFGNTPDGSKEMSLPAMPRHIPLQRPLIDLLTSELASRAMPNTVKSIDQESVDEKSREIIFGLIEKMMAGVKQSEMIVQSKLVALNQKAQQLKEIANRQPQNEQEAREIERIRSTLPQVMAQLEHVSANIESEEILIKKIGDEAKRVFRYDYKYIKEEIAENILIYLKDILQIENEIVSAFTNNNVTGRHYYYVDQLDDDKYPTFTSLEPSKVFYPKIGSVSRVNKGPWVVIEEKMSFDSVMTEFGGHIRKLKNSNIIIERLEEKFNDHTGEGSFVSTPEGAMEGKPYHGSYYTAPGISVDRVFFKSQRVEKIKFSPNPHKKGKFFKAIIDPTKKPVNTDFYHYDSNKKAYVSNDNDEDIVEVRDAEAYSLRKGQYVEDRYTNDVYEAVVIDNDIVVAARKKSYVPRYGRNHGDINLPVFGRTHTSLADRPHSLIFDTKDIQTLYDTIHTQRELMIALAGTKTIINDRSQKPDEMSPEEWDYERKKGLVHIQTIDANGNPKRTPFNQWSMVDLSLSPAVQYLDNVLISLETSMGNIIGIPPSRKAQVQDTDQVGTFKESIRRSFVITEVLYNKHEEIASEALTHMVNLAGRHAFRNGGRIETNDRINGRRILEIPANILKRLSLKVLVESSGQSQQKMNELRELAAVHYKNGQLPFLSLIDIFDAKTVNEMRSKVKYFTERAEQMQAKIAQAERDDQRKLQMELQQYAQEFDAYWKQKEFQIKEFDAKFQQSKEQFDQQLEKEKLELERIGLKVDSELRLLELQNEKESEDNVVVSNNIATKINAQLKQLELYLNHMQNAASMNIDAKRLQVDDKRNKMTHQENMKKVTSDNVGKKIVKEHASDR